MGSEMGEKSEKGEEGREEELRLVCKHYLKIIAISNMYEVLYVNFFLFLNFSLLFHARLNHIDSLIHLLPGYPLLLSKFVYFSLTNQVYLMLSIHVATHWSSGFQPF